MLSMLIGVAIPLVAPYLFSNFSRKNRANINYDLLIKLSIIL